MAKSIFISSTSKDLIYHRAAVKHVIERLEHRAIDMLTFGSQPGDAVEVSLDQVRKADIFIGIIAHRYGYIPEGETKSVTQLEYEEAIRQRIPRLIYLVNPDQDWYAMMAPRLMKEYDLGEDKVRDILIEQDTSSQQKLFQFKIRLEKENVRSLFDSTESLAHQVSVDIARLLTVQSRQRWSLAFIVPVLALAAFLLLMYISDFGPKNQVVSSLGWATPTPLEGAPAVDDEIVVVVSNFQKSDGVERTPELNILDVVRQSAREVGNVRVIAVNHSIHNEEEARAVAEVYRATVVIYGRIAAGGVIVGYQIMPYAGIIKTEVEGDFRIASDQVENFETFLFDGMNANFIVGLTSGQLLYFKDDRPNAIRAFTLAINSLDESIRNQPQAALAYAFRGLSYRSTDQDDLALDDFEKAVQLDPELALAYSGRGVAYRNLGEYEKALSDNNKAIQLAPDDPFSYFWRAGYYIEMYEFDLALADYQKAEELNLQPAHWIPNEISRMYSAANDYEKSMEYALIAYELAPNDFFNLYRLGYAYYNLRDYAQARTYFARSLERRAENNYYSPADIGDTYFQTGDFDQALTWYEKSLAAKPDYGYSTYKIGAIYTQQENYDQARSYYERAVELQYPFAYVPLGTMYENGTGVIQDYRQAFDFYQLAADANERVGQYSIGRMYEKGYGVQRDYSEALRWYQLASDQHYSPGMVAIGVLYANGQGVESDLAEAIRWYEKAIELHDSYAYHNLADYYERGEEVEQDIDKAVSYYQQAINYADPVYDDSLVRITASKLAAIYQEGSLIPADSIQAAHYFQIASDAGDLFSKGALYEFGYGVKADEAQAADWYLRAANSQGSPLAMKRLVIFYTEGRGLEKNPDEASRWQRNSEVNAKRFTIPCDVEGQELRVRYEIIVLERPGNPENPLEEEAKRLWEEHRATIPTEVIESFAKLYQIAEEQNVSYTELMIYALEAAAEENEAQ